MNRLRNIFFGTSVVLALLPAVSFGRDTPFVIEARVNISRVEPQYLYGRVECSVSGSGGLRDQLGAGTTDFVLINGGYDRVVTIPVIMLYESSPNNAQAYRCEMLFSPRLSGEWKRAYEIAAPGTHTVWEIQGTIPRASMPSGATSSTSGVRR